MTDKVLTPLRLIYSHPQFDVILPIGELQGVLEQIATLAVIGGYPGSLLFGFFVSDGAPFFWPGASFALAAVYSLAAAAIFYNYIFNESNGFDEYPVKVIRREPETECVSK